MIQLIQGDALEQLKLLPDKSVQCCVTSPPYYGLRDYGIDGQIGLEQTPKEYIDRLMAVFREVKRVLRDDGTCWVNIGDSYAGSGCGTNDYRTEASRSINKSDKMFTKHPPQQKDLPGCKPKDLIGIPWMFAFAMRDDGWYLRSEIIWAKKNSMTESVKDRPTQSHEKVFLLTKKRFYYYDYEAVKTITKGSAHDKQARVARKRFPTDKVNGIRKEGYYPKANLRNVWHVATKPYKEAHFATYPPELITPCILAGSKAGDTVLDPFNGAGTTGLVALQNGRSYIGIDLNPDYLDMTRKRLAEVEVRLI